MAQEEDAETMRSHHLAVQLNWKKYMKKTARLAAILPKKEERVREPADAVNKLFYICPIQQ